MNPAEDTSIEVLIQEVETLGAEKMVMPFDLMNLAYRISDHPERRTALPNLVAWMDHTSNFTRDAAHGTRRLDGCCRRQGAPDGPQ
jgi:hypothetical protein